MFVSLAKPSAAGKSMKALFLKENILLRAAVIFFTLVAALFYFTSRQRIENGSAIQSESSVPNVSEEPAQTAPQNNAVNVKESIADHTTVRYEKGSFAPREVIIANGTGCFVEIQNESENNLTPRVGPYDPKKERGFLYPPIPPHGKSLIDPRYGTIASISFYGKENPTAQFSVHMDPTCL